MSRPRTAGLHSIVLAGMLLCAAVAAREVRAPDLLSRLALSLDSAEETTRADFAAIALGEMITAHEVEFGQLSAPGQVSRKEVAKQARWGRALARFLDDLYAARDALDAGAPVELLVAPPGSVQLMIGNRLVAIGSPRIDAPQVLEELIVRTYCDTFVCDPGLFESPDPVPDAASARPSAQGGWSFVAGQGSTYETRNGLGFMFTDVRDRARKEQVCLQLAEELDRLSGALAVARQHGRAVDVNVLRIDESGRGDDQLVMLSASGDPVRLALPALSQALGVLDVAREWIAARSRGEAYRQRFPRAELLLSRLLAPR